MCHSINAKGVLCDISGVLKDSVNGEDVPIEGSLCGFSRLQKSGLPFVLCTNESCYTTQEVSEKLNRIGFDVKPSQIISPVSCIQQIIQEHNLRPHVLVHQRLTEEFQKFDQTNPDTVIVGDAEEGFTYESMNKVFELLIQADKKFYCLGKSKFYKDSGKLKLDVGCWVAGLEYASQRTAEVVGKPSHKFFNQAAKMLGLQPADCVMIGDDVESDVGGAQWAGFKGVLVRTGKCRPQDETHETVKPDLIADNFNHAMDVILGSEDRSYSR